MHNKKTQFIDYIQPLEGKSSNYDALLDITKDASYVLIGESTHGTHEFYQIRIDITKRLILEYSFNAIAIEADWPDAYNINRYIKGDGSILDSVDALAGFRRFPTWMWRNKVVMEFIDWLKDYNSKVVELKKVGFYGLDLYGLNNSVKEINKYLEKTDPEAAEVAKQRYSCFDDFKKELQYYGYATTFGLTKSCEEVVSEQLIDLNKKFHRYLKENGSAADEFFYIEQNALLVKNAEKYYRSMFDSRDASWNVRDMHMAETLGNLAKYLTKKLHYNAKIIVWAHNSHVGDARATESGSHGQLNLGQLVREKYDRKSVLIGFLTYSGTVTAASAWDDIAERRMIRPAIYNSYEYFLHNIGISDFFIIFRDMEEMASIIDNNLLERAIGVIYAPQTERTSHYFYANLPKQFDAVIYLDNTTAITPLETTAVWHKGEVFETFPSGL